MISLTEMHAGSEGWPGFAPALDTGALAPLQSRPYWRERARS